MNSLGQTGATSDSANPRTARGILAAEAEQHSGRRLEELEKMAARRYQHPEPERSGRWWYLRIWKDTLANGVAVRKRQRIKLAPADTPVRKVKRIADEILRPQNQELVTVGAGISFQHFVTSTYIPTELPLLASTTQANYETVIDKYVMARFGAQPLCDLTPLTLQRFFSGLPNEGVEHPTRVKIRDAMSSVLRSAVRFGFLGKNPMEGLRLPPDKRGERAKPFISPMEFHTLLEFVAEPYASAIFVATWTGLRVSELAALRWRAVHEDSLTIEQRYTRGDWSKPKTPASAGRLDVVPAVIDRIQHLKHLIVDVRAGRAIRHCKVVKVDGLDDLVFQGVYKGGPLSDGNVLRRHIKPAAKKLGLHVNWRALRTSHATWLAEAGAGPKDIQGQLRHTDPKTAMGIYCQIVRESQRRSLEKLTTFVERSVPKFVPLLSQ